MTNFEYFRSNLAELFKLYPNKHLVLKDCEVINAFDDENEALDWAVKNVGLGNFTIQECTGSEDSFTIHARARYCMA